MIIDLIDKFIDRCIQLVKYNQEIHRGLFYDYVNPIFLEFESIHNNYLKSFHKYRKLIKSGESFPSILDMIQEDHLFTEGERHKLLELGRMNDKPLICPFIHSIHRYLMGTYEPGCYCCNYRRRNLIEDLILILGKNVDIKYRKNKS